MSEQRIEAKLPDYGTRTDEITIYAGPCSVESEEQFFEVAECISDLGLTWIRGGAYKPRTNPHSFQAVSYTHLPSPTRGTLFPARQKPFS